MGTAHMDTYGSLYHILPALRAGHTLLTTSTKAYDLNLKASLLLHTCSLAHVRT